MAFQQLYYTSCEHGLRGFSGFQFNAATPGVAPAVMREVESLTSYEPPRSMPGDPSPDQLASYPVAFSYSLGSDGSFIVARVVYVGPDYSGRPGNYFAHALVTESVADFGPLLPVNLWAASLWRSNPVENSELPSLPGPLPGGQLDRARVQEFLSRADPSVMPVLLSAVDRALTGDRSVLLAGQDCEANAIWIAAVSYLVGAELARQMSFTTYSHRPAYAANHIIGVLSGSDTIPADQSFHVYDAATGRLPDVPVHPVASLLTRAGIMQADSLWQQAATMVTGPVRDFDGWHPLLAAAAALRAMQLDPQDVTAVETWLGAEQRLPSTAGLVLEKLVDGYDGSVSDDRITAMQAAAVRLKSAAATERLELVIVERACARLERAEPAGKPVQLTRKAAKVAAASRFVDALYAFPAAQIPALLRWAADAGVVLEPGELRVFGNGLQLNGDPRLLATILDGQPEIVSGVVGRLAAHQDMARDLFARTDVIALADLDGVPGLQELWLIGARNRGDLGAMDVLNEIKKLRGDRSDLDIDLLHELWPRSCSPDDLRRLLPLETLPGVRDWLIDRVIMALNSESGDDQVALANELEKFPKVRSSLPFELQRSVSGLSEVSARLKGATAAVKSGNTRIFKPLYDLYARSDPKAKKQLAEKLPRLLCDAPRLDQALRGCPKELRTKFCDELNRRLYPTHADAPLAARVFVALLALQEVRGSTVVVEELTVPLMQVLDWSGPQRRTLKKELGKDEAEAFDQWREKIRPGMIVKIRSLFGARKDGDQ